MPVIQLLVKNLEAPTLEGILKLRTGIVRVLRSDVATERSGSGLGGVCLGLTLIIKLITGLFFSWEASPIYVSPLLGRSLSGALTHCNLPRPGDCLTIGAGPYRNRQFHPPFEIIR